SVPVVAVCDTNIDPTGVKYIIPGNDDATKTVKLVLDYFRQAIGEGKAQMKTTNHQVTKKQ
ncbi:MAG: 30S ribosomal protein S2, partial [Patescibacteria group bacterium]